MSFEEKLEMRRIIITSGLSDEKVGKLNKLLNKAMEEAKKDAFRLIRDEWCGIRSTYRANGYNFDTDAWLLDFLGEQLKENNENN